MNTELTVLNQYGIKLQGGRIAKSIKDHFRFDAVTNPNGLKGKALRDKYLEVTRANAAATSAVQGECDASGFLKEITSVRSNKEGQMTECRIRYFKPTAPKSTENAKDKEIAALKAKLAEMEELMSKA